MGDFVLYLPPVFSIAGDKKRKNDDGETGGPRQRNGKRGKGGKDSKRVTNEEFDDELKLSNEEWKMISGNKELLKLRPKLADDLPLCHRWCSRGYCFPNCSNVKAHSPPTAEKKTEHKAWLVKAKKSVKGGN
jgi:hypothetical protein